MTHASEPAGKSQIGTGPAGPHRVSDGNRSVERMAADWFMLLREEPDDAELREQFDEWLAADVRHAAAWADVSGTARIIANSTAEWDGYDIRRSSHRRGWRLYALAGLAAAACIAGLMVGPDVMLRLKADRVTGTGQTETVQLDDGSVVHLAPRSALAYDFSSNHTRTVRLLEGEALFEVRHDAGRPFVVRTAEATTTDLGTVFDVRTDGDVTTVAVRSGRVRVKRNDSDAAPRELGAGDWWRAEAGATAQAGSISPELVADWTAGTVFVQNQPISEVIAQLRSWYSGRIIQTDSALSARKVTGAYDLRHPEETLRLIVEPYGGRVVRITPWVIIIKAH